MSRIQTTFADLQSQKKKALITFITAGDPAPELTVPLMQAKAAASDNQDRILVDAGPAGVQTKVKAVSPEALAAREKAGATPVNPKAPGKFLLRGLASVTDDFLTIANNNPDQFDEMTQILRSALDHAYKAM